MDWIKQKWHGAEYKTKFYTFLTAAVALLFATVFLLANMRFYKNGTSAAALTQRNGVTVPVHNGGIISVIDACPPFQWMGAPPDISIPETELPFEKNGAYIVTGSLEDACLRLIQAGFVFDTDLGGTALISKTKRCYLYLCGRILIAQIEDIGG